MPFGTWRKTSLSSSPFWKDLTNPKSDLGSGGREQTFRLVVLKGVQLPEESNLGDAV